MMFPRLRLRLRMRVVVSFTILAAVVGAGCSQRYDVNVAWTIDGFAAKEQCPALPKSSIQFRLEQQDQEGGPLLEEVTTAACAGNNDDGVAVVQSAAFAKLFIDLLEDNAVFGTVGPILLQPGFGGDYTGQSGADPVRANVELQRGRLLSRFTVVGEDCGAAGAESFIITMRRNGGPLNEEVVVDGKTVDCNADGVAAFDFEPVEIGSQYNIEASATVNGDQFSTSDAGSGGVGHIIDGIVTNLVVDLDLVD